MSELRTSMSPAAPDGAGGVGTVLARDDGEALEALSAYFGAADDRLAVHVFVGGEDLGYLDRDRALDLMELQSRGLGDSIGARLPGVSDYESIELCCDVPNCTANPIYDSAFDEMYPPSCPEHPEQTLRMASP
jgi:hypothetical protein